MQNESLAKHVYHSIKDAIFAGDLEPGQAIREMHVARSLEVSQATVREALVQLQQMGLVVREQNRRTIVTAFTREELKERLGIREVLEKEAAVEAARKAASEELDELEQLAKLTDDTVAEGKEVEGVRADLSFHRMLWKTSGNETLARTLNQITTPLFAFLSTLSRAGMADLKRNKSHRPIVDALRSGDELRIRHEIGVHLDGLYQGFLDSGLPSMDAIRHEAAFAANRAPDAEPAIVGS